MGEDVVDSTASGSLVLGSRVGRKESVDAGVGCRVGECDGRMDVRSVGDDGASVGMLEGV